MTGGSLVTIAGTNLDRITAVVFGAVPGAVTARPVEFSSVEVVVPKGTAAGAVPVTVTGAGQTTTKSDAYTYAAVAPGKATGVAGAPGNGQVAVTWTPPANAGGVRVASYSVSPIPGWAGVCDCLHHVHDRGVDERVEVPVRGAHDRHRGVVSDSDASAEVAPYIATGLSVSNAKAASYRLKRRGSNTLVSSIKVPKNANRVVTRSCTNGKAKTSKQLCTFTVYKKSGKVKVGTKGYRNVVVTLTIQSVPRPAPGRPSGRHRHGPHLARQVAVSRVPVPGYVGTGTRALWDNGGLSGVPPDPSSPTVRRDPCKTHFPTS